MKKYILLSIFALLLVVVATNVSAANEVGIDVQGILKNITYYKTSTVTPNFNVTGNATTWTCKLYSNRNGTSGVNDSWTEIESTTAYNNTNTNFSHWMNLAETSGHKYCWNVFCNATEDSVGVWGVGNGSMAGTPLQCMGMNFTIDLTPPSLTVLYPTLNLTGVSSQWINNSMTNTSVRIGLNISENNTGQCILFMDYNLNGNVSASNTTVDNGTSYTSGTIFQFAKVNETVGFGDNNTGYSYNVVCNDSANWTTAVSGVFYVDVTNQTAFDFNWNSFTTDAQWFLFGNDSKATDYTPQLGWNYTNDTNMWRFEVNFYPYVWGNTTGRIQKNISLTDIVYSGNYTRTNISTLSGDIKYFIEVIAYDNASNYKVMESKHIAYNTRSVGRSLSAGWNIIGNIGDNFNLSKLREWTGATTVSIWNATHQFQSHISGGSHGEVNVTSGDAVLIYVSSATTFSDMIENTTALLKFNNMNSSLTNQTSSDWNLIMNKNWSMTSISFQCLDNYINNATNNSVVVDATDSKSRCSKPGTGKNITTLFLDYYNNSASTGSKYIPFVANWSINNGTEIRWGEAFWAHFTNQAYLNSSTIDWNNFTTPAYNWSN